MRGRKPTPTEQRVREGNPQHRRMPQVVILGGRVEQIELRMPPYLTPLMRRAWRALAVDLAASGTLDRIDAGILEDAAVFWGRAREARRQLLADQRAKPVTLADGTVQEPRRTVDGLLGINSQGWVAHPLLKIERDSWQEFRQVAEHLGLSIWARSRLGMSGTKGKPMGDELGEQLGAPARLRVVNDGEP